MAKSRNTPHSKRTNHFLWKRLHLALNSIPDDMRFIQDYPIPFTIFQLSCDQRVIGRNHKIDIPGLVQFTYPLWPVVYKNIHTTVKSFNFNFPLRHNTQWNNYKIWRRWMFHESFLDQERRHGYCLPETHLKCENTPDSIFVFIVLKLNNGGFLKIAQYDFINATHTTFLYDSCAKNSFFFVILLI